MAEEPYLRFMVSETIHISHKVGNDRFYLLAGSLAVLHLVLRSGEGVGVVRALVVADDKVGVTTAKTVVISAAALRVLGRLLRNAEVQDAVSSCVSASRS